MNEEKTYHTVVMTLTLRHELKGVLLQKLYKEYLTYVEEFDVDSAYAKRVLNTFFNLNKQHDLTQLCIFLFDHDVYSTADELYELCATALDHKSNAPTSILKLLELIDETNIEGFDLREVLNVVEPDI